ncbi:MAG: shikimate dehydrogenase [Opitutales bacterium]|nr:shikimate dehydrogenase [Opitutales bacterium]
MTEKTYTLGDLSGWRQSSGTDFAVLGYPVSHSLSPRMHNAVFEHSRERQLRYFKFEVPPEKLQEALALFFEKGFAGLNLTLPHKILALPFLQSLDFAASQIGAANTLYRLPGATAFSGTNTDGEGFCRAVSSAFPQAGTFAELPLVLLGAGGAARAIAFAAANHGCRVLWICNRTTEKARDLADDLKIAFPSLQVFCDKKNLPANALLVNATALGLGAADESPFSPEDFEILKPRAVYDITYGKHVPALVKLSREKGVPASDGRSMLAWQGALAQTVWRSVPAEKIVNIMQEILEQ